MGHSYCFECSRCGYRAKVSGRADRGLDLFVQTIVCRDCKELYDAVTRLRISEERHFGGLKPFNWRRSGQMSKTLCPKNPPSFQAALSRLQARGIGHSHWLQFRLQCPVSATHRVQSWDEPNKCPRCGLFLERNVLPYRIWD